MLFPLQLVPSLIAALLTAGLLFFGLPWARRAGLVDHPGGRKDHALPTPVVGGLAILIGVLLSVLVFGTVSRPYAALLVACGVLALAGLIDDLRDLPWYWRIGSQVLAALILVYGGGVRVDYVGELLSNGAVELGVLAVPFTVIGTVGVINAINMCDGSDGLAGTLAALALVMLGAAAVYAGNFELAWSLLPFVAAIGAFLLFNLRSPWMPRAQTFLGNAGSEVLGLVIAWAAFRLTQNAAHPVSPALAPWLLAPPVVDCLVLMIRRVRLGRSPFQADRGHMHHLLLDAGLAPTAVVRVLALVSCVLGLSAGLLLTTNIGTEMHLVLGFALLTLSYYVFTHQHQRAVAAFRWMRGRGWSRAKTDPRPATVERLHPRSDGQGGTSTLARLRQVDEVDDAAA